MKHARARYLESKRSVDDRALSIRVRDRLLEELPAAPRILEVGCGTGVTVQRLLEWGVDEGQYHGVDTDERIIDFARAVGPKALRSAGYEVTEETDANTAVLGGVNPGYTAENLSVRFVSADAFDAFDQVSDLDVVVAQAFADLVPLPQLVDAVESAVRSGGVAYFPITFDGGTIFQPDHPADDRVEAAYHAAIDEMPGRDVHAGRHLADLLRRRDGKLLAMGSSDWIVRPRNGSYPADERYFLKQILQFVEDTLSTRDARSFDWRQWIEARRQQLRDGELTYVAHGFDLLYQVP